MKRNKNSYDDTESGCPGGVDNVSKTGSGYTEEQSMSKKKTKTRGTTSMTVSGKKAQINHESTIQDRSAGGRSGSVQWQD